MSEVIESYIRRHPDLSFQDAMESFLKEDRIQDWIGGDLTRRERLEREFLRVWNGLHPSGQSAPLPPPQPKPAPPPAPITQPAAARKTQSAVVVPAPEPQAVKPPPPSPSPSPPVRMPPPRHDGAPRQMQVLCPVCRKFAVYAHGTTVSCARCGTNYDDMLGLIPAKAVGPFAFVFGEGWKGVVTFLALALLLVLVYGVLQWF